MKKIILLGLILGLAGCMSTANFFEVQATSVQNSGYWTGQYDRLVGTLKLNSDGTGVICQDGMGTARVMSVKNQMINSIHRMAASGKCKMKHSTL